MITIDVIGLEALERDLTGVEDRFRNPAGGAGEMFRALEASEGDRFAAMGGFDVLTGASRAALTADGTGALRRAHGETFEFGSTIAYDVYHPEMLADLEPETAERAALALLNHIVGVP